MGWFSALLPSIAVFLFFYTGRTILMVIAIITVMGCLWSWGIMHNYATELAKRRPDYKGEFYDITEREAQNVPDWISIINILFSLVGLILLIIGIVMIIRK